MTEANDGSVAEYLVAVGRWRFPPEGELGDVGDRLRYRGWRRWAERLLPDSALSAGRLVLTRIRMTVGGAPTVDDTNGIRLHLGCGEHRVEGWTNVDLMGARADLVWDLRRPLPIDPGTVDAIFHEHFLEHLPLVAAVDSLRACHDLLRPGGVLRIGVPDFAQHAQSYLDDDGFLTTLRPGRPSALLALNEVLYGYGHRSMWDEALLTRVLTEIGFTDVRRRRFGETSLDAAPDSPDRARGTLYVEARRRPVT